MPKQAGRLGRTHRQPPRRGETPWRSKRGVIKVDEVRRVHRAVVANKPTAWLAFIVDVWPMPRHEPKERGVVKPMFGMSSFCHRAASPRQAGCCSSAPIDQLRAAPSLMPLCISTRDCRSNGFIHKRPAEARGPGFTLCFTLWEFQAGMEMTRRHLPSSVRSNGSSRHNGVRRRPR
jgi:hypothetical protein